MATQTTSLERGPDLRWIIPVGILLALLLLVLVASATHHPKTYGQLAEESAGDLLTAEGEAAAALDAQDFHTAEEKLEEALGELVVYRSLKGLATGEGADVSDLNADVSVLENLLFGDIERLKADAPEMYEKLNKAFGEVLTGQ